MVDEYLGKLFRKHQNFLIELNYRHQTRQQQCTLRYNIHQTRSRTPQRQQTPNSIFSTTAVRVGFYSNPTIYSDQKHSNSYKQNKQRLAHCITLQNNQNNTNTKASNSNNRRQKKHRKMDRQTDRQDFRFWALLSLK